MYSGIPQLYRLGFGVVVWHEDTPISLTNHRVIKETKENEKAGKDIVLSDNSDCYALWVHFRVNNLQKSDHLQKF